MEFCIARGGLFNSRFGIFLSPPHKGEVLLRVTGPKGPIPWFGSVSGRQKMQQVPSNRSELERTVEHEINERTSRRVQNLRVELINSQIVMRGSTRSYYVKLLALEAARDIRALICPISLLVEIEVI